MRFSMKILKKMMVVEETTKPEEITPVPEVVKPQPVFEQAAFH